MIKIICDKKGNKRRLAGPTQLEKNILVGWWQVVWLGA